MLDILKTNLSTANLVHRTETWSKAAGVTFREGMRIQGGLLIKDLVSLAGPNRRAQAETKATKDVKMVFAPVPDEIFKVSKRGGNNGRIWLYASPAAIVGVKTEDYQPKMEVTAMRTRLRLVKHRGKKWIRSGTRGQQAKMILNRVIVGKGKFKTLVKTILDRFGLQKAAWAVGWRELGVNGSLPGWVSRHLTSGHAKGVLINGLNRQDRPFLQIVSRATGVEKRSSLLKVRGAIRKRMGAMQTDIKLYLKGIKKQAGFKHS